jgi:hypothetical protein
VVQRVNVIENGLNTAEIATKDICRVTVQERVSAGIRRNLRAAAGWMDANCKQAPFFTSDSGIE